MPKHLVLYFSKEFSFQLLNIIPSVNKLHPRNLFPKSITLFREI